MQAYLEREASKGSRPLDFCTQAAIGARAAATVCIDSADEAEDGEGELASKGSLGDDEDEEDEAAAALPPSKRFFRFFGQPREGTDDDRPVIHRQHVLGLAKVRQVRRRSAVSVPRVGPRSRPLADTTLRSAPFMWAV
jgi:hypothetical protein